jgi:hypothetical protein
MSPGLQDGVVAVVVVLAALFLWRRFRPRRRKTVAVIPLSHVRRRPGAGGTRGSAR